jgi:hypothetical protein
MKETATYMDGYSIDTNDYDCEWQYVSKLLYLHMDGNKVPPANSDNQVYNRTTNRKQCKF